MLLGCGTRNTALEVSKSSKTIDKSVFIESDIKKDVNTSVATSMMGKSWDISTLKNSNAEFDIEETFDKEGKITGRKTKARFNNNEQATNKGSSYSNDSLSNTVDKSSTKSNEKKLDKSNGSNYKKDKDTQSDTTVSKNVGGAVWLYAIIGLVVISLVFLKWKGYI